VAVYGVAVVVAAAPLMIGSGPTWAQLLSSGMVFAVALLFVLTRGLAVRTVPFALPLALAAAMILFQLIPLPAVLVRWISPLALELRTEASGGRPFFLPLTLDVPATLIALCKAVACLALLLIVGTAARRISRARPLVLTLAFIGAVVAAIHIVQRLTGSNAILGLYPVQDLPGSGFFGTFVNANQASSLLALSGLVAAGVALETDGIMRLAALGSSLLSIGVTITAGSRAGLLGLAVGTLALGVLVLTRRLGRTKALLLSLMLVTAVAAATLAGSDTLRARVTATASNHMSDQKIRGWRDSARLVVAYPWTGVGRGAFEAPATAFRSDNEGVRLAFPENIFLQLAGELGVPFTLGLLVLAVLAARRTIPSLSRLEPSARAAACGVLAVLVHELADFGLELPGVAFPAVAALGLVVARTQEISDPRRKEGLRVEASWVTAGLVAWTLVFAATAWAGSRTLLADGTRGRAALVAQDRNVRPLLDAAIRRHPADYYLELLAGTAAIASGDKSAGRHLGRAQRLNPTDPSVHRVTARWLAKNGHRSQAAIEFRLARERGAFITHDELWSAVGPRYLADAVPQTQEQLQAAAAFLLDKRRVGDARTVSARAVAAAQPAEPAMEARLKLAVASQDAAFIEEAARALLSMATEPPSFAAAATALAQINQHPAADAAIDQGLLANPHNAFLALTGAHLRIDRGDLTGAITVLQRAYDQSLTLKERIEFEEVRASIAEKRGDAVGAATYHARARSLARLRVVEAER
jgi:hypothetical protein